MRLLRNTILLLLFTQLSFGQEEYNLTEYDSTKIYTQSFIDTLTYQYASGNGKGTVTIDELGKVLKNNPQLDGWIRYYAGKSTTLFQENKIDSALYYLDKGINHFKNISNGKKLDEHVVLRCYLIKGVILRGKGDFKNSLKNLYKASELADRYGFTYRGYIYASIADNHIELGNDSIALAHRLKLESDTMYMKAPRSAVTLYNRIGVEYARQNKTKRASAYYRKAIKVSLNSDYKRGLPSLYGNIGQQHELEKNVDSALYYYSKALASGKEYNLKDLYTGFSEYQLYYKSYLDYHQGNFKNAETNLKEIIKNIEAYSLIDKDHYELLKSTYLMLGSVYQEIDKSSEYAYLLNSSYKNLEKSLDTLLQVNLDKLEQEFQSKQKDRAIIQLEETAINQKLILKQRGIINWILAILLFSLLGLSYSFYKRQKQKHKYNAVILEQRLLRSQLNPHFLFNSLNTINSLAEFNPEKINSYVSKLGLLLRSILKNSREELVSVEEELDIISAYLELQSNFSQKFKYQLVAENIRMKEVLIPPMFIQPFVENSIVHGFKGLQNEHVSIRIVLDSKNACLHCQIKDNGIGYSKSVQLQQKNKKHNSLSGLILKQRLAIYAKTFKTKSYYEISDLKDSNGTLVDLYLPFQIDS